MCRSVLLPSTSWRRPPRARLVPTEEAVRRKPTTDVLCWGRERGGRHRPVDPAHLLGRVGALPPAVAVGLCGPLSVTRTPPRQLDRPHDQQITAPGEHVACTLRDSEEHTDRGR